MHVHQIPSKRGTEIFCYVPLSVLNFIPIGAHIRVLWQILQHMQNEKEKKTKKLK